MRRIDQSNQNIDIEQEPGHRSSSRSWWTNSEVTRCAPLRTLRSGTPFRVLILDSPGESACLARDEITSPTVFFSTAAISLAALNTSSSITRVVRMNRHLNLSAHHASDVIHHTSDAHLGQHFWFLPDCKDHEGSPTRLPSTIRSIDQAFF